MNWDTLANQESIDKTVTALQEANISTVVVDSAEAAKATVLELLPKGVEVMTMTSITLSDAGIAKEIEESGNYDSVRKKLSGMNRETEHREMQRLGAAPEWAVGSVHAVTEDGKVVIASNTGSQLPAYVYGADHVIWVIGTQKIVKNLDSALKRIYDYVLPLETQRARKAYNLDETFHSNVSKVVILNKELTPKRITMVLVKEKLGF
ncbi:MAG: LUD domain-containing protein [Candidatus Levyibacteriota bacterium]